PTPAAERPSTYATVPPAPQDAGGQKP
ncbi:4-oxalocrotonate tautomerase, partial [Mesorhizobium sp. B2-3-3]